MLGGTALSMLIGALVGAVGATGGEAVITVHAGQVTNAISPYMTGACIEDVNHEIYGGIYSQMVFGESFQEPALSQPPEGFTARDGVWRVEGDELAAGPGQGPRLLLEREPFKDATISVDILLPDRSSGVAGVIARATDAGPGVDNFFGYEISLDALRNVLVLGKHRKNWEHIRDVPCELPINAWIALDVKLTGQTLEVSVQGKSVATYEEANEIIESGSVMLRPFARACRYRNLRVATNGTAEAIPFKAAAAQDSGNISAMWRAVSAGSASGTFALNTDKPFVGAQCQRITFSGGEGRFGIENRGLNRWGMCFVEGKPYEGRIWLRADSPAEVWLSAESADGTKVYAETRVDAPAGDWIPADFTLLPTQGDTAGRLAVTLRKPGTVDVGYVFLQPGEWGRLKGLPVRKDVAEALIAQKLTVLRYGGSMVNAPEYRWKKMAGARDKRPPYKGTWYPYSTNGWGIIDFIDLCEACGFLYVPAFNMGETPEDMADFMEYVNGPASSPWGAKRAATGHPEPYRLKYLELGNEEKVDDEYLAKFRPLAEAIWKKDKDVTIVVGDFAYDKPIEDPFHFTGSPVIHSLAAQQKILEFAKENGRAVWFDVHVGNNEPDQPHLEGTRSFIDALDKLCPGADHKVVVFEENSANHAVRRALGHANAINQFQRMSDRVPILCAANCLQPYKQNDNDWDQGMVFLTPSQVWGQPPYYVTQMIAGNYLPNCVAAELRNSDGALDVTAKTNENRSVLVVQVLNIAGHPVTCRVETDGFNASKPSAKMWQLSGALNDVNTPEEPTRIVPKESEIPADVATGKTPLTLPAYSFSVLRFE